MSGGDQDDAKEKEPAMKKVSGASFLKIAGTVSTKVAESPATMAHREEPADRILNQEELDRYWAELMESTDEEFSDARALLKDYHPEIDATGCFHLKMPNSFVEAEFAKYRVSLLKRLRTMSGSKSLNVKVEVVHVEVKAKAYRPEEKYQAMLERNPDLAKLKELFPAIDY